MTNEDMNSLMERYKKQLIEFERRNKLPRSENNTVAGTPEALTPVSAAETREAVRTLPESLTQPVEPAEQERAPEEEETQLSAPSETEAGELLNRPQTLDEADIPQPRTIFVRPGSLDNNGSMMGQNTPEISEEFKHYAAENTGKGFLRVETFGSNDFYPVSNSRVVVYKMIDSKPYYIYDVLTNTSGIVENLELPAPARALSLRPENNGVVPYSTYDIYIDHPNFVKTYIESVPIFDGIISIQPVEMIPSIEGGREPDPVRIIEREPSDLRGEG